MYHSIDGYHTDNVTVKAYQEQYKKIAQTLDVLFLTEPRATHASAYQLDSGTLVIPCDPVVRKAYKSPEQVKIELGLAPEDEFIYVQGGMSGSEELRSFVISASSLSLGGLKLVLAPLKGAHQQPVVRNENLVHMLLRLDAQNVVAAAAGVISKPGMGILCEAIAHRKPLLLLGDIDPEREVKYTMLQEILGDGLPFRLHRERAVIPQIAAWLEAAVPIAAKFAEIPCEGAASIVRALPQLQAERQGIDAAVAL